MLDISTNPSGQNHIAAIVIHAEEDVKHHPNKPYQMIQILIPSNLYYWRINICPFHLFQGSVG